MLKVEDPVVRSKILQFYKRPEIQRAIVNAARDKEIAIKGYWSYNGKRYDGFAKRPDVLKFPQDVLDFAIKGATSFHASEELWYNPLQLNSNLKPKELNEIRQGWDLLIDIDCAFLEYSKIAAHLIIQELKNQGIKKSVSCKFSGNHGFHIGVPFEAFPEDVAGVESRLLFPKIPMRVALFLKDRIEDILANKIIELEGGDIEGVINKTGKTYNELVERDGDNLKFKMDDLLEIDTILISSRHLYRMPYSFNEKSGWVSVPIDPEEALTFDVKSALPENVTVNNDHVFLDRSKCVFGEAKELFQRAYDYIAQKESEKQITDDFNETHKKEDSKQRDTQEVEQLAEMLPEDLFPPCIRNIKEGIEDGKKRALFGLVNYLTACGWKYDDVEAWLKSWNKNNAEKYEESLKETMLVGQVRYHKMKKKLILPPNCDNKNYYKTIGAKGKAVCQPDKLCSFVKNPVQYAKKKAYFAKKNEEEEHAKKVKEENRIKREEAKKRKIEKAKKKLEEKKNNIDNESNS
jgi:hypothetical protein